MKQSQGFRCIFCAEIISQRNKPEHIILNALGGRLTTKNVVCDRCNHDFGVGPDQDLVETAAFVRNMCNLKAGDGDAPPALNGFESDGQPFRLDPGMQPKPFSRKPLVVEFEDQEIRVQIEAYSDAQADKLAEGAARKIAKRLGYSEPRVVEAIKVDLLKDKKSSFRPGPRVRQSLQFGEGMSQQAKAKACLVFWAHCVGSEELHDGRYDAARCFARFGNAPDDRETLIKIDTRPLPLTPDEFGQNPNVIWVGSDGHGKIYGYFRLYGAIGWRILLCEAGGPPNQSHSLISNPLNNQIWKVSSGDDAVFTTEWVFSEWNSWPPEYEQVTGRLQLLMAHSQNISQDIMLKNLFERGGAKADCGDLDIITDEQVSVLSSHVGRGLAAYLLKKEIPED